MYKKVLVPLDGSELAECALPHLKNLAKEGSIGEVILFKVVEMEIPLVYPYLPYDGYMPGVDFQTLLDEQYAKSTEYLDKVQAQLLAEGIKVEGLVVKGGRTSQAIVDYVHKNKVDLIVIASHGYTGMKKMLLGSVAYKVLHESHVPVLLIRPESCQV